jgi:ferritin-like metal-binding protein YciE
MPTTQKRATTGATRTKGTSSRRSKETAGPEKRTTNGHSGTPVIQDLEEGFVTELADMLYAERELLKLLPRLAQAASSRRLRDALEWHTDQCEDQVRRLERVFQVFGHKAETEVCEGMQGILAECKEALQKAGQGPVRDAMIIASTQKADHYAIASFGTLCAWADQLGEDQAVRLLADSLFEVREADRNLSRIAENLANPQAERGSGYDDRRDSRRFRDY